MQQNVFVLSAQMEVTNVLTALLNKEEALPEQPQLSGNCVCVWIHRKPFQIRTQNCSLPATVVELSLERFTEVTFSGRTPN